MDAWPSRTWVSSSVPPAAIRLVPKLWRSMCGWTGRSRPARRDRPASSSFSAPGRIGAPIDGLLVLAFDQHKVAVPRPPAGVALHRVLVKGQHQQPIDRDRTGPAGLGQRPVRVLAATNVQMLTLHRAAKMTSVHDQVDVLAAQTAQLPASQARA